MEWMMDQRRQARAYIAPKLKPEDKFRIAARLVTPFGLELERWTEAAEVNISVRRKLDHPIRENFCLLFVYLGHSLEESNSHKRLAVDEGSSHEFSTSPSVYERAFVNKESSRTLADRNFNTIIILFIPNLPSGKINQEDQQVRTSSSNKCNSHRHSEIHL